MPDLPPIGSLWLHRESGERRFVCGWHPDGSVWFTTSGRDFGIQLAWLEDWLDRETTT